MGTVENKDHRIARGPDLPTQWSMLQSLHSELIGGVLTATGSEVGGAPSFSSPLYPSKITT